MLVRHEVLGGASPGLHLSPLLRLTPSPPPRATGRWGRKGGSRASGLRPRLRSASDAFRNSAEVRLYLDVDQSQHPDASSSQALVTLHAVVMHRAVHFHSRTGRRAIEVQGELPDRVLGAKGQPTQAADATGGGPVASAACASAAPLDRPSAINRTRSAIRRGKSCPKSASDQRSSAGCGSDIHVLRFGHPSHPLPTSLSNGKVSAKALAEAAGEM